MKRTLALMLAVACPAPCEAAPSPSPLPIRGVVVEVVPVQLGPGLSRPAPAADRVERPPALLRPPLGSPTPSPTARRR